MADLRSRKYQLTINNPADSGFTQDIIINLINEQSGVLYFCMADEIGESGTYHTHVYICYQNARTFTCLKNLFPTAHIELANGTSQQNRDYVFKQGKWLKDKKSETQVLNTQYEYGEMPIERQGQRNDLSDLYDMIHSGMSDYDIIASNQNYMMQLDKIQRVRRIVLSEKYKHEWRQLDVTYLFGETGSGKTRSIMEKYGYENVYRITDEHHPWDSYSMQDVICFEEFRGQIKCQDMLNYLDGYPLELPCRYENKVACYTKVYILSNIPLEKQYEGVQNTSMETFKAFKRRIHHIEEKNHYDNGQANIYDCFEELSDIPF